MSKVDIYGDKNIRQGGSLVIPNKLEAKDLLAIESIVGMSRITYLVLDGYPLERDLEVFLSRPGVEGVMLSPDDPDPASVGRTLEPALQGGRIIIFVPGKAIIHKGGLTSIPVRVLDFLCGLDLPIVPLFIGRYGDFGEQIEGDLLRQVIISFRPVLEKRGRKALPGLMQGWLEAGEKAMSSQPFLNGSLGAALVRGMKANPKGCLIDGVDDKSMPNNIMLGVAIAFSKRLKELVPGKRVGVILPPGKGAALANLACVFAGKIPVNINFTASKEGFKSSVEQAGIDQFITADPFMRKLPDFPWPPLRDLILLEQETLNLRKSAKRWVLLSRFFHASVLIKMLNLDSVGGDDEAVLLFTSGSSGLPKGVPLSHRNMLGNVAQCRSRIVLSEKAKLLGCLPIFHSYGITITLWFPLICGYNLVTYPSPREAKRLGELIEKHSVELAALTPTFLRGFIKRVPEGSLSSVKHLIVGAEKLPPQLSESFYEKFGFYPVEGFGLTETSPVCSVNMHNAMAAKGGNVIPSEKSGTVGQLLPGIAIRITDTDSYKPYPLTKTGMIWLKGANVFYGYINQEKLNREIIKDGWFCTGDVGHMDPEGFLHIEGRISRFSKIGGEMVPHEQLEIAIMKAMGLDPADSERHIAVLGVPDKQKGEAIVLVSTIVGPSIHQELLALRYKLLDLGIPALWCPKYLLPVESIPIFNSGKLDLPACEAMVKKALENGEL